MKFRILLFVMTLWVSPISLVWAEEKKEPTVITSDGPLNADFEKKIALFEDNVFVKDPQGTINADKMKVFFAKETNQIEKMECFGNVKIKQEDRRSESQKAVYYALEGKIVLTGDPVIHQGNDDYRAEKITIFAQENRVIFEPSAQLLIFPDKETGSKTSFMN